MIDRYKVTFAVVLISMTPSLQSTAIPSRAKLAAVAPSSPSAWFQVLSHFIFEDVCIQILQPTLQLVEEPY